MRDDREPYERWFTRGTGMGLLAGIVLGFVIGDIFVGLMAGLILGAGIGVLANPRNRSDRPDRPDPDEPGQRRPWLRRDDDGAMDRGLMWLLVGFGVAVVAVFATAPELLFADALELGQLLVVILAAGIPGLAIIALVAYRRRGHHDEEA